MNENQVKSSWIKPGQQAQCPLFSPKAAVKEHAFRLGLDVCFRPGDIRIFLKTVHKTDPLAVNTSALAPESGH